MDKIVLQRKRYQVKKYLKNHNYLPNDGSTPNEEQQIILNQIKNNDFSFYNKIKTPNTIEKRKQWRQTNKERVRMMEKRKNMKITLIRSNILPKKGVKPNKEQKLILEMISNNDFSFYDEIKQQKKKLYKQNDIEFRRRSRILSKLRHYGILPGKNEPLNKEQTEIVEHIRNNPNTEIEYYTKKYIHLLTPELSLLYRVKRHLQTNRKRKSNFNITVDDIIIPKRCPYLGVKLITDVNEYMSPNYYSLDRIDSKKGYIKGNVQVISRLANTMKNNASIKQLITFSENVIKLHK